MCFSRYGRFESEVSYYMCHSPETITRLFYNIRDDGKVNTELPHFRFTTVSTLVFLHTHVYIYNHNTHTHSILRPVDHIQLPVWWI